MKLKIIVSGIGMMFAAGLMAPFLTVAQTSLTLNDLSAFRAPGKNWQIAGDVNAVLNQSGLLKPVKGQGVLVNIPVANGTNLFTNQNFSDIDLELDYLMAKESNSGIYLQGKYEVQLFDSWATLRNNAGDNGGIYERWDDARGNGNEGYDGHASRQNVSRAPGLWQHLKISFQAPRFDANGKKAENARFLKVELNGVVIHEDVEVQGPTRSSDGNNEVASGPVMIQGDHGAVAIRNIKIKNYNKSRPSLTDLKYSIYPGKFETLPDLSTLTAESAGNASLLSSSVVKSDSAFLLRYTGNLVVTEPGQYTFDLSTAGGSGLLMINNQAVKKPEDLESRPVTLPAGKSTFELVYSKTIPWEKPALGLMVSADEIREFQMSDAASINAETVDPILVDAGTNTLLRSFMDIPGGKRVVHAINVGSAQQLHYTYDLDHGMLLQAWRGGFLDVTPMWHDRGDGSSLPLGAKLNFGDPSFALQKLLSPNDPWKEDSTGTNFRNKGYEVDGQNNPTFKYIFQGASVTDAIQVADSGRALKRTISINHSPGNLFVRIASGKSIEPQAKGWYLVDDKSYYLHIDDAEGAMPIVRESRGNKELLVPVESRLTYSLIF